jgi:hypothetical protein
MKPRGLESYPMTIAYLGKNILIFKRIKGPLLKKNSNRRHDSCLTDGSDVNLDLTGVKIIFLFNNDTKLICFV